MNPAPLDQSVLPSVIQRFGSSHTLPADAYLSPEVLAWEQENIFRSGWVCLGRTDELLQPGQVRGIEAGGESVLLTRDSDSALRAYSNVCRHRGHELVPVGAALDARLIRCPYHSWSYRFDGSLRAAPTFAQTPGFETSDYPLIDIAVEEFGGWTWIDMTPATSEVDLTRQLPTLAEQLGNLAEIAEPYETDRLITAATHTYVVDANWKIIVENYNECYHCSSIHPELCEVTPPDSGYDHVPTGMWLGGTMDLKDHAVTMSLTGESRGIRLRRVNDSLARQVWYLTVMPNLLLSLHPDYVMTHRLMPLAVDKTFIECSWLFPPEAFELDGFDPSYAVDFWDITNREDWSACEAVMRGVRNRGYRPGPLSSWEGTVYQFLGVMARLYLGQGLVVPEVPAHELR